jgi:hypothetical protein
MAYVTRFVRYPTASGHPATAASSVEVPLLQNAASAARSTSNDAPRTVGKGHALASISMPGATLTMTRKPATRR